MVKPIVIALGAIPAIVAILLVAPLITKTEIPFSASNPSDRIEIEYTKHQLITVSHGITERTGAQKSEILNIKNNGDVRYTVVEDGAPKPDQRTSIDENSLKKLKAMIKETGFMAIPSESFPIKDDVDNYQKSTVKVTLNGAVTQIHWPNQNATEKFIPPIITMIELELDQILDQIRE